MQDLKKYSTFIIAGAIIIVAIAAYVVLRGEDVPADPMLLYNTDTSGTAPLGIGQDILVALEDLKRLKLDTDVFSDPSFQSLVDFAAATTSEPLGKPDPFEPLPKLPTELTDE